MVIFKSLLIYTGINEIKLIMKYFTMFLTRLKVVAVACDTPDKMITGAPDITSHPLPLLNRVVMVFGSLW